MTIEEYPLKPFLPANAKVLFLGSFPPPKARWSMEFFYPNWINDFWRIQGEIHFNDKAYFEQTPPAPLKGERKYYVVADAEQFTRLSHEAGEEGRVLQATV